MNDEFKALENSDDEKQMNFVNHGQKLYHVAYWIWILENHKINKS